MLTDPGGLQTYLNGTVSWNMYETFDINGTVFSTRGTPPVKRGQLRAALGNEVATCSFTILCGAGSAHLATALSGAWDGVPLTVNRIFNGNITLPRFKGVVSDVRPSSGQIEIVGRSFLAELKKKVPGRVFGTLCPYVFEDADCGTPTGPCEHSVTTCTSGNFGGFTTIPAEK
jgi:hypothetical protein